MDRQVSNLPLRGAYQSGTGSDAYIGVDALMNMSYAVHHENDNLA